jgi:hypothetical protein
VSGLVINPYAFAAAPAASDTLITTAPTGTVFGSSGQWGWEFQANANLNVTALRLRTNSTPAQYVFLWRVSDTTLLASETITPTSTADFAEVALGTPVALTSGAKYVLSARGTDGSRSFRYTSNSNLTLKAAWVTYQQARYLVTASSAFPTSTEAGNIYGWVDARAEPA